MSGRLILKGLVVGVMFLKIYYIRLEPWCARSNVFLDVEACSEGILALTERYGKSPCFSRYPFLCVIGVDWRALVFVVVDGAFFLD